MSPKHPGLGILILLALSCSTFTAHALPAFKGPSIARSTVTIHMRNFLFDPDNARVQAGSTVVFINDDDVSHNVTGGSLKSGDIPGGKSWPHTFSTAGTYTFVCTYHPGMSGTITVAANSQ